MNEVTDNFNIFGQELPRKELFHYITMEGLKSVVVRKTIWATNIEFLDDSSEFRHGEKFLKELSEVGKDLCSCFLQR